MDQELECIDEYCLMGYLGCREMTSLMTFTSLRFELALEEEIILMQFQK